MIYSILLLKMADWIESVDKADKIISSLFENNGNTKSHPYSELFKKWKSIILDDRLADHCRLEDINNHSIRVSFDHPGWIQVFKMNQKQIMARLNNQYPGLDISSVSMHLRDEKLPPPPPPRPDQPVEKEGSQKSYRENLNDIKDEDLKNMLRNLKKTLQGKK